MTIRSWLYNYLIALMAYSTYGTGSYVDYMDSGLAEPRDLLATGYALVLR